MAFLQLNQSISHKNMIKIHTKICEFHKTNGLKEKPRPKAWVWLLNM